MLNGFLVAAVVPEVVGSGEFPAGRIGLRGADDLDVVPCLLQHRDHLLAPPAEADHGDFDGFGLSHSAEPRNDPALDPQRGTGRGAREVAAGIGHHGRHLLGLGQALDD